MHRNGCQESADKGLREVGCVVYRNECRESPGHAEPTLEALLYVRMHRLEMCVQV